VETFCEAKPQKSDLQPVERTKCAVLERLVMGKAFFALLVQSKKAFPVFKKPKKTLSA
jgi:hypothetical protein